MRRNTEMCNALGGGWSISTSLRHRWSRTRRSTSLVTPRAAGFADGTSRGALGGGLGAQTDRMAFRTQMRRVSAEEQCRRRRTRLQGPDAAARLLWPDPIRKCIGQDDGAISLRPRRQPRTLHNVHSSPPQHARRHHDLHDEDEGLAREHIVPRHNKPFQLSTMSATRPCEQHTSTQGICPSSMMRSRHYTDISDGWNPCRSPP